VSDASEHELRAALEGAPVGVGLWDAELRYRWVNAALAEMNGVPAEEHVGHTLEEIVPQMPPEVFQAYRRVLETGVPLESAVLEGETRAQPGRRRAWAVSVFPILGADGGPHGIASIIEDVTALQEARDEASGLSDELALERRVLEEVVERVPLGITLLWGRELRYRLMNEQGRQMLPERGPLVGRTPADAFPETAATFAATVLPLFDTGDELVIREYPLPFDDDPGALDGRRYYDVTFTPISLVAGEVLGVLVAYLDVTEQLRRRRELERELLEERLLSDTLQRSLLPRRLPEVPHLDVAARYQPAGSATTSAATSTTSSPGATARGSRWSATSAARALGAAARTSMVRYCLRPRPRTPTTRVAARAAQRRCPARARAGGEEDFRHRGARRAAPGPGRHRRPRGHRGAPAGDHRGGGRRLPHARRRRLPVGVAPSRATPSSSGGLARGSRLRAPHRRAARGRPRRPAVILTHGRPGRPRPRSPGTPPRRLRRALARPSRAWRRRGRLRGRRALRAGRRRARADARASEVVKAAVRGSVLGARGLTPRCSP
jgi:PAS domain S-box-containing protein